MPPGRLLALENGQARESVYWDWRFPEQGDYLTGSDAELTEQLYELLADATRIRLRADVPVGAYFSGGLDSSALVTLIRRHSAAPLKTFLIGFEENSLFKAGIIDSTGVPEIILFIEETFGFKVKDEKMLPENLDSIDNLVAFVQRKQAVVA